jgi:hypothetical protein
VRLGGGRWTRSPGNAENLDPLALGDTLNTTAKGRVVSLPLEGPRGGVRRSNASERTFGLSSIRKPLSSSLTDYPSLVAAIHWCLRVYLDVVGGLRNIVGSRRPCWSWAPWFRRPN